MSEYSEPPGTKVTSEVHQNAQTTVTPAAPASDGGNRVQPKSMAPSEENAQSNGMRSPVLSIKDLSNKDSTAKRAYNYQAQASQFIDPLSNQILKRTQTDKVTKPRTQSADSPIQLAGSPADPPPDLSSNLQRNDSMAAKEKKKGVSFLSRFNIKSGKRREPNKNADKFESDHPRTEGMNAHVFSSYIGAGGFIPQYKEPPSYIKVRTRNKKQREFDHMFLAQELRSDERPDDMLAEPTGTIWTMEFSLDGRYLAAAGRDHTVRLWAVLSTPEERRTHEHEEDAFSGPSGGERLSAPVFKSKPIREYEGHTGDILDVNWSKNNFLLSSSMDKSVKLWHTSRQECLCTFSHEDFVTSIAFHPTDDRFFLSGSLDSILRLWSIPEKKVAYSNEFPDLITAVAFTPNGKIAIAGGLSGLCQFFDIDPNHGLSVNSQIHVRSSRGKNAKGSKITGIRTMGAFPDHPDVEDVNILVTSNDSRIRLYSFKDKRLEMKFQGHENTCSQIKASFSDDGRYVVCGSENRKTYIWNTSPKDSESKEKPPLEIFNAHSNMVTTAIMAPAATRRLLSGSGDPIYDVCNPPPVTLLSLEESYLDYGKRLSDTAGPKKFEGYPGYLARTSHDDGPIIVTSDYTGSVKCFRLDCAYEKRHQWDAGSNFSKKRSSLRRANSIVTRNSTGSRHNSISRSQSSFNIGVSASVPLEQILSWRSDIKDEENNPSQDEKRSSFEDANRESFRSSATPQSQNKLDSTVENLPYSSLSITARSSASVLPSTTDGSLITPEVFDDSPSQTYPNTKSNFFRNISSWRTSLSGSCASDGPEKFHVGRGFSSEKERGDCLGGSLSRELSGVQEESQECVSESDDDKLCCTMCEGADFRGKRLPGKGLVMVCVGCGAIIG